MGWKEDHAEYMKGILAKKEAFNKEMTPPLLAFLKERYGSYRVSSGYVYLTLPEDYVLRDFLDAITPYITCNEVTVFQGRVGIRLRFC